MHPYSCLLRLLHVLLWQYGFLCIGAGYSDNNKPYLTFCPFDTDCSHTDNACEELPSPCFLCTDISLFITTFLFSWSVYDSLQGIFCGLSGSWQLCLSNKTTQLFQQICDQVSPSILESVIGVCVTVEKRHQLLHQVACSALPNLQGNKKRHKTEANVRQPGALRDKQCLSTCNTPS